MALRNFDTDCILMKRKQIPSPNGGGMVNVWKEGETFRAAISTDTIKENMFAGQLANVLYYSIFVDKDFDLQRDDYFISKLNNRYIRVASLDRVPPKISRLKVRLMYGEYVDKLPD